MSNSENSQVVPEKPASSRGLRRIVRAFGFSLRGLQHTFSSETAFRQEVLLALVLVPLSFYLPLSVELTLLLNLAIFFVLAVELLNSAIEEIVDRVSPEFSDFAARAKDMGSAAVLISLVALSLAWGMALYSCFLSR